MTLRVIRLIQDLGLYQMQFDEHLCDIWHGFNCHGASRGPSATAELLVFFESILFVFSKTSNFDRSLRCLSEFLSSAPHVERQRPLGLNDVQFATAVYAYCMKH